MWVCQVLAPEISYWYLCCSFARLIGSLHLCCVLLILLHGEEDRLITEKDSSVSFWSGTVCSRARSWILGIYLLCITCWIHRVIHGLFANQLFSFSCNFRNTHITNYSTVLWRLHQSQSILRVRHVAGINVVCFIKLSGQQLQQCGLVKASNLKGSLPWFQDGELPAPYLNPSTSSRNTLDKHIDYGPVVQPQSCMVKKAGATV